MGIEVSYGRGKSEVQEAILQFAARRGYRLTYPWYTEGPRIEKSDASDTLGRRPARRGLTLLRARLLRTLWRTLGSDQPPRIDLTLSRKQGKTVVKIELGSHRQSVELAYGLKAYLAEDRAYDCLSPPICPMCGVPVANVMARFCGRCGQELLPSEGEVVPPVLVAARQAGAVVDEDARRAEIVAAPVQEVEETAAVSSSRESVQVVADEREVETDRSPMEEEGAQQEADRSAADAGEGDVGPGKTEDEPPPAPPVEEVTERRAIAED